MAEYSFQNQTFVIEQYDKQKTFASFLPGSAGKRGIPMWAFYVNRGQGISQLPASARQERRDPRILPRQPGLSLQLENRLPHVRPDQRRHP
ncbi:MAG: hypothetical protein MZU97_03365 [Bacillus subtilis]|nr:hypothetical protein [Bacillus subtilis]